MLALCNPGSDQKVLRMCLTATRPGINKMPISIWMNKIIVKVLKNS